MICPRCGIDNPIPEATKHRCVNCGFLLYAEAPREDIHQVARRRNALRSLVALVVLAAVVGVVWSQEWFGLFQPREDFVVSDQPVESPLLQTGPVTVPAGDVSAELTRRALWGVNGIVLANQSYSGTSLDALAPNDLLVAWGAVVSVDRRSYGVTLRDRMASVATEGSQLEPGQIANSIGLLHLIPANDQLRRALTKLKPGAEISLDGVLVTAQIGGQPIDLKTAAGGEGKPATFLVYITALGTGGTLVEVPAGE